MTTSSTSRAGRRTTGFDGRYQILGDVETSPEEEADIEKQMAQLKADPEPTVSTALRWGRSQLDIIRRAASLAGIPYQTYLKEVAFRGALQDLKIAREAGVILQAQTINAEGSADAGGQWTMTAGAPDAGGRRTYRFSQAAQAELSAPVRHRKK